MSPAEAVFGCVLITCITPSQQVKPLVVTKKALDVTPWHHGIYCTVGDGESFVNRIVNRRWSEDGEEISFMLDSHNFYFAEPDEEMAVVEMECDHLPQDFKETEEKLLSCDYRQDKGEWWLIETRVETVEARVQMWTPWKLVANPQRFDTREEAELRIAELITKDPDKGWQKRGYRAMLYKRYP